MTNIRKSAALLPALALALAACGSSSVKGSTSAGTSASSHGSGTSVKIGVLAEETGQFSWYGTEAVDGARLYLASLGSKGTHFSLDVYNTASSPEQAVIGFRKLVQQDGVSAVIGLGLTDEAAAVAPLAASLKIPLYALSGSFTPPNSMTFALPDQIAAMQRQALAALSKKGMTRVALLTTTDATGQIADSLFTKLAPNYGMKVVADEHMALTDVSVTPQLTRIRAAKPDLIISWEIGKPLGVVFNDAHQLGLTTPFLVSYGNLAPGFLQSLASVQPPTVYVQATKDTFWKSLPSSDPQAQTIQQFHSKYLAAFHQETGLGSASGYDATELITKAIQEAGSGNSGRIVSTLESFHGSQAVQGVLGTYDITPTNHVGLDATKNTLLGTIKAGQLTLAP